MRDKFMNVFMILLSIMAGAAVIWVGDWLLGVRLEYFDGPYTFSAAWILDLFLVPVFGGLVVSMIYGLGGKMWCYFSPIIVRGYGYYDAAYVSGTPPGVDLLPLAFWVLIVIVAVEAAAIGGVMGEILVKRTYGRRPPETLYKKKSTIPAGKDNPA